MHLNRKEEFYKLTSIMENININIANLKDIIDKSSINEIQNSVLRYYEIDMKSSIKRINRTKELVEYIQKEVITALESIKELENPFLIFIVGQGNYGKSTLVNAFLKENLIKTSNIPNT